MQQSNMKLTVKKAKQISGSDLDFQKSNWQIADIAHFGKKADWKKASLVLKAFVGPKLVGILELTTNSGVMMIDSLIVDMSMARQGIGRALMSKAIEYARANQVHKITLETGSLWPAVEFYRQLGFAEVFTLKNHYLQLDYVFMELYLD